MAPSAPMPNHNIPMASISPARRESYSHHGPDGRLYKKTIAPKPLSLQNTPNSRTSRGLRSRQSKATKQSQKKAAPARSIKDQRNFRWIIAGSFTLCFNAGFINSLTLSTVHGLPSAHVTGMVARASIGLAAHNWELLWTYAIAYLCFLMGSTISGMLIQHETFYLGRNYGRAFLFIAVIQSFALLIEYVWTDSIGFVFACALACGIQNALTSKYSGNVVRTTHLTGATTDLGIALGHILKGREDEWWRVLMHTNSVSGFLLGGIGGWFAFQSIEHMALLVNIALTTLCGMVHTLYIAYHENLRILDVLEATEDIKIHRHRVTTPSSLSQVEKVMTPQHHHHHAISPYTPQMRTPHTPQQSPNQLRSERPPRPGLRPTLPVYHHHHPHYHHRVMKHFELDQASEEKMDNSSIGMGSLRGYQTPQRTPPMMPAPLNARSLSDLPPLTPLSGRTDMPALTPLSRSGRSIGGQSLRSGTSSLGMRSAAVPPLYLPRPTMVEAPHRPMTMMVDHDAEPPVLVDDVVEVASDCSSLSDYDENEIELPPEEEESEPEFAEGDVAGEASDEEEEGEEEEEEEEDEEAGEYIEGEEHEEEEQQDLSVAMAAAAAAVAIAVQEEAAAAKQ